MVATMPVGRVAVTVVLTGRGHGDGAAAVDSGPGTVAVAPRALAPPYLLPLGPAVEEPAPDDRYHAIYFAMLLAGVGFLLPYNSFITDVDYLHHKYPGGSPAATPGHRHRLEPVFPGSSLSRSPSLGCQPCSGGARKRHLARVGAGRGAPPSACSPLPPPQGPQSCST